MAVRPGSEVLQVAGQLGDKDRIVLVMWFGDCSIKQISKVLNVSEGAVKMRKLRAMEKARALMAEGVN